VVKKAQRDSERNVPYCRVYPGNATSIECSGFGNSIYLTFTLRSYNYLLQNLTPPKLKTVSSLSCVLAPGFFLVIPSPLVLCLPSSDLPLFCTRRRILTHPAPWQTNPQSSLYWPSWQTYPNPHCPVPGRRILTHTVLFLADVS
jgi:hypothetical protein